MECVNREDVVFPESCGMGEKQPSTQHLSWKVLHAQNPSFQGMLQVEIKV